MRRWVAGILGAGFVVWGGLARGNDTNYQDYPLGGRAVGLGGAFTALGNDPSGLYYNPAGLVDTRHVSVQVSTNLYGLEITDTLFSGNNLVSSLNTVATELNIIPTSASFIQVLDEGSDGRPNTSLSLGAFVPSFRSFFVDRASVAESPDGCNQISYQRNLVDRTFMPGIGVGHRVDEDVQFGVSAFLPVRTLRDTEDTSCFGDPSGEEPIPFASASTSLNMVSASILMTFGVKLRLPKGFLAGLTVTSPSIAVWDVASVRVRRSTASPGTGQTDFLLEELDGLGANTRHGTAVRLGGAWVLPKQLTLTLDMEFRAPAKYQLVEIPATELELTRALTLVTDIERLPVVNLSLGAEYHVLDSFTVSAGVFSNFSSAADIPGPLGQTFSQDRLRDVDGVGGSLVLGFLGEYTLTRIGFTVSYGAGDDVVPQTEGLLALGRNTDFVKVDFSQVFVFFFVSSAFRY